MVPPRTRDRRVNTTPHASTRVRQRPTAVNTPDHRGPPGVAEQAGDLSAAGSLSTAQSLRTRRDPSNSDRGAQNATHSHQSSSLWASTTSPKELHAANPKERA